MKFFPMRLLCLVLCLCLMTVMLPTIQADAATTALNYCKNCHYLIRNGFCNKCNLISVNEPDGAFLCLAVVPTSAPSVENHTASFAVIAYGQDLTAMQYRLQFPVGMSYIQNSAQIPEDFEDITGFYSYWKESSIYFSMYADSPRKLSNGTVLMTFSCTVEQTGTYSVTFYDLLSFDDAYNEFDTLQISVSLSAHHCLLYGHSIRSEIVPSTCLTQGYTRNRCTYCSHAYNDSYTPLGNHSYRWVSTASCTQDGVRRYTCRHCGRFDWEEEAPATGHTYENQCCTGCGIFSVEDPEEVFLYLAVIPTFLPQTPEDPVEFTVVAYGGGITAMEYYLEIPEGLNYIQNSAQISRDLSDITEFDYKWGESTMYFCMYANNAQNLPNGTVLMTFYCTPAQSGTYTVTPSNCKFADENYNIFDLIPVTPDFTLSPCILSGHQYSTRIIAPDCTQQGYTEHICSLCQYSYPDAIVAATGHSYEAVVTAPTCTEDGYTTYTCTCGDGYVADEVAALGHSFAEGVCSVCSAADPDYVQPVTQPTINLRYPTLVFEDVIMMNVYFAASDLQDVAEMGLLTYTQSVETASIETASAVIPGYAWSEADSLYYATTNGIAAKDLGDEIFFAVYAKLADGTYTYTRVVSYSPSKYAYASLSTGSADMKPIVVAMLNYGTAAQNYFGYKTDSLVNADLPEDQKALVEDYRADMITAASAADTAKQGVFVKNGGFSRRYPTVSFEGAFCINYYCIPSATVSGEITMYYWDHPAFDSNEVLTEENVTDAIPMVYNEATGEYNAAVEGIAAKDLSRGVYVAFVYSDDTTTYSSGVMAYSIGTYCSVQASGTGAAAELAKATAVYGYYANRLFG